MLWKRLLLYKYGPAWLFWRVSMFNFRGVHSAGHVPSGWKNQLKVGKTLFLFVDPPASPTTCRQSQLQQPLEDETSLCVLNWRISKLPCFVWNPNKLIDLWSPAKSLIAGPWAKPVWIDGNGNSSQQSSFFRRSQGEKMRNWRFLGPEKTMEIVSIKLWWWLSIIFCTYIWGFHDVNS